MRRLWIRCAAASLLLPTTFCAISSRATGAPPYRGDFAKQQNDVMTLYVCETTREFAIGEAKWQASSFRGVWKLMDIRETGKSWRDVKRYIAVFREVQ
jgi:hypothetical protein